MIASLPPHLITPGFEINRLYQDGPLGRAYLARPRGAEGEADEVLLWMPAPGASQQALEAFAAQGQRLTRLHEVLMERGEPGVVPAWHEVHAGPPPVLMTGLPVGPLLSEQIIQAGRWPEVEGLELARRVALLLEVLHGDLELAAAPLAFAQARWHAAGQQLWLPVWQGALSTPSTARQAHDLEQAGDLLHLALLGQPLLRLWGRPVLPLRSHPAWQGLSSGAQRLLRRLLHPEEQHLLRSAGDLRRDTARLARAWRESPERILADAEDLLDAAHEGVIDKALEAADLLDILHHRESQLDPQQLGRWVLQLDELRGVCAPLVEHAIEVDRALQLAAAGSQPVALEVLQQADNGVRDRLALARWQAVLADPAATALLREDAFIAALRQTLADLEGDDLDAARAHGAAWTPPLASLSAELVFRLAWREAAAVQADPSAALATLSRAQVALDQMPAPLRQVLDQEMGRLASWRQAITASELTAERNSWAKGVIERVQAACTAKRWADAVGELRVARAQQPSMVVLAQEAQTLGLLCLSANQPAAAADAFALGLADGDALLQVRLGWCIAQALAALQADPVSGLSVAEAQTAVGALLAAEGREGMEWPPLAPLRLALESGLEAGWRRAAAIPAIPAGWAVLILKGELQRLRGGQPAEAMGDPLEALQEVLYRSLTSDRNAAVALTSLWLSQVAEAMPVVPVNVGATTTAEGELSAIPTAQQVAKTAMSWLRQSAGSRIGSLTAPAGPPAGVQAAGYERILDQLLARDLSVRAEGLGKFRNEALKPGDKERLGPIAQEVERSLAEHKEQMAQIVIALARQNHQDALDRLRRASNKGKSPVCWDWDRQEWTPLAIWQERIQSGYTPVLAAIQSHLQSQDPARWDYVLRLPPSFLKAWPPEVQVQAGRRLMAIEAHRAMMVQVFQQLDDDPAKAASKFAGYVADEALDICWDPSDKRWAWSGAVQAKLDRAGAGSQPAVVVPSRQDEARHKGSIGGRAAQKAVPVADGKPSPAAILNLLSSNRPQDWDMGVQQATPANNLPSTVVQKVEERRNQLANHRRDMDRAFRYYDTTPSQALNEFNAWRSGREALPEAWNPRKEQWQAIDAMRQDLERAAATMRVRQSIQIAGQHKRDGQTEMARQALNEALKERLADQAVLDEARRDLAQLQPSHRSAPAEQPSTLATLLERPLAESKTPTELRYRLQELPRLNPAEDRLLQQQIRSLESWPLRDRWLADLERTAPQTVSHADREDARNGLKELEEMLAQPWWHPFASLQTPVFARAQERLTTVAHRNHAERGEEEHH